MPVDNSSSPMPAAKLPDRQTARPPIEKIENEELSFEKFFAPRHNVAVSCQHGIIFFNASAAKGAIFFVPFIVKFINHEAHEDHEEI